MCIRDRCHDVHDDWFACHDKNKLENEYNYSEKYYSCTNPQMFKISNYGIQTLEMTGWCKSDTPFLDCNSVSLW